MPTNSGMQPADAKHTTRLENRPFRCLFPHFKLVVNPLKYATTLPCCAVCAAMR